VQITAVFWTAKKRGETRVFREVRRGFAKVKPEIKSAILTTAALQKMHQYVQAVL